MPNIMFGSGSDNLLKTSPKFRETADLRGCLPCTRMKITVTVFVFSDKHKQNKWLVAAKNVWPVHSVLQLFQPKPLC